MMRINSAIFLAFLCLFAFVFGGCDDGESSRNTEGLRQFELRHDAATGQLWVTVSPNLSGDETLHVRVRQGPVGQLDCANQLTEIPAINSNFLMEESNSCSNSNFLNQVACEEAGYEWSAIPVLSGTYLGPIVTEDQFKQPYDITWLEIEPTPEMLLEAEQSEYTIDICLMNDKDVIRGAEMDIFRAMDKLGTGKFDDYGEEEVQITSVVGYAQECVKQMGEIPFFEPIGDEPGDYATYSCLDSVPIPTTVTDSEGNVTYPEEEVSVCDNPQFIYSLCEPNAVDGRVNGPRVASRKNEQGTHWVLLCRKSLKEEGEYNDIAMLGHNPYTGKTCFFQNALYSKRDGLHVPHPADEINSTGSPEQSESLWSGIQGGIGSGIECVRCHDSDSIIHTPWIDGAKDENGDPVIPKMGIHDGFSLGFAEAPYSLVDLEGQDWKMPKVLVNEEAAACTKCHRIGSGRWTRDWTRRLVGKDSRWNDIVTETYQQFENMFWMPPELIGLDEATWEESEYGKAVEFILGCDVSYNGLPPEPEEADEDDSESDGDEMPGDNEEADGDEEAAYPECKWEELPTEQLVEIGELPTVEIEGKDLATEALKILGARVIDPEDPRCNGEDGSCVSRRCSECHSVSKAGLKHWRKLTQTAKNSCGLKEDPDSMTQEVALASINCLRTEPEDADSVFAAEKVGIFTTGARYGYFRKLFQKAYGPDEWLRRYMEFKARVHMPKGTYAALSQMEHAVLMKWFDSNLEALDEVIVDPPAPSTCEPYLDTEAMSAHIEEMKYEGWRAANKEAGVWMFGCNNGAEGSDCLTTFPDRDKDWGNGKGTLREVLKLDFKSSFWTRSSADGRYIANGGGSGYSATVTDMLETRDIGVPSTYDPGFFPDNSGFIFQGGGTAVCAQSILEDAKEEISFDDPSCMRPTNINLYQHVARGLNGGDYFIINSQFTSDAGNGSTDPRATFNVDSSMKFTPMIFNGTTYEQLREVILDSPYEGDSVLSPSSQIVVSRLAGAEDGGSLGFVLRKVSTEKFGDNYNINTDTVLTRICTSGAKANISYDERFMITHHYQDGKADIILFDLLTGEEHQITNMPEGVRALFPHFRSDNWFYFLVKGGEEEYVVASDFALVLEKGGE